MKRRIIRKIKWINARWHASRAKVWRRWNVWPLIKWQVLGDLNDKRIREVNKWRGNKWLTWSLPNCPFALSLAFDSLCWRYLCCNKAILSNVALALFLIFSSVIDGGLWIVSKTDLLFGVVDLDDTPSLGVLGVSGSGRLLRFKPLFNEPRRSCQACCWLGTGDVVGVGAAEPIT